MEDCIFCKIVAGEIPAKKIFENENLIAFFDIAPKAPTHFLVVPKKHISRVDEMRDSDRELFGEIIFVGQKLAREQNLKGFKMLFNVGPSGGQVVPHVHLHVLGGGKIDLKSC